MQLTGKVALITGAASGIGKAAALLLAKESAKVAVLGRTEDELKQTVNEIQQHKGEAISLVADISQPDQIQLILPSYCGLKPRVPASGILFKHLCKF